jgi:hypothetical protein
MRLLRLPVAAGRLQRVACGSPPPLPPSRARLIARRSSGVVDARAPEAEAAHPVAACGFCAACGVTHSLPRTPAAEAAAAELLARVRATGRLDFDAPVPVRIVRSLREQELTHCLWLAGHSLCGRYQVPERLAAARAGPDAGRAAGF